MTFLTNLRAAARREEGLTLIEVVITAFMVALIAVGTLTGFQEVDRASADNRFHNEAALIAAQSQEQLRSNAASTLDELAGQGGSSEHRRTYSTKVDNTTYTVTQEAQYFNEAKSASDCAAIGTSESSASSDGDYLRVTSRVTWPQLEAAKRTPVSESSIITPPDGSTLEVDATTGAYPNSNLAGVGAIVKYTGVEATEPTTTEGTTGTAGCLVFGALPTTSAKVEIKPPTGYVTESGSISVPAKEVTIAPNITTHYPVVLNEGGAIKANFTNASKAVEANTFVAAYEEAKSPSEYTVGAPKLEYESGGEYKYKTVTSEAAYATSATTPIAAGYSKGDLFPFPFASPEHEHKWQVYAGDCKENNAHAIDSAVANGEAVVSPGLTSEVSVPVVNLTITVYKGTSGTTVESKEPTAKITNTACSSASAPINASEAKLIHEQKVSKAGNLKYPYQPFGKEKICLVGETTTTSGKTEYHIQTIEPDLTSTTHKDVFYLGNKSSYTAPSGAEDNVTVTSSTTSQPSC